MTTIDLSTYFDFSKISDEEYCKSKHLKVRRVGDLSIMKYDKEYLTENMDLVDSLGMFRSVIVDNESNKVVSFAPPKSYKYDDLKDNDHLVCTEYVEGTMINVFWNKYTDGWELATRSNIGGKCKYNLDSSKTFRYMFLDAMNYIGLEFADLNKNYSYSFVLQHPENRIVIPIQSPDLILISMYSFDGYKVTINNYFGKSLLSDKIKDLMLRERGFVSEKNGYLSCDYKTVGYVYTVNGGFKRTKIRNREYEFVRRLKGNSPKLQFQYYNLLRQRKIQTYLNYYPEHKDKFLRYRDDLYEYTATLYQNYIRCYIQKEMPLKEFDYKYRSHMFKIHELYKTHLKPRGKYVNKSVVIEYLNKLHPAQLMYSINYHYRKNEIENDNINKSLSV